jgi:hypothetical protein
MVPLEAFTLEPSKRIETLKPIDVSLGKLWNSEVTAGLDRLTLLKPNYNLTSNGSNAYG